MCIEQLQQLTDEELVLGVIARKLAADPDYDEVQGVIDEPAGPGDLVRTEAGFGCRRITHLDKVALGECRDCHARVLWGTTERGKKIPLEVAPAPAVWLYVQRADDGLFARSGSQGIGYRYHVCEVKVEAGQSLTDGAL